MTKSVKVTLHKIQIKNPLIRTPKVSVILEFGDQTVKLPNARFAPKNQVSFFKQPLRAASDDPQNGANIIILGVTGSHEKEIGSIKITKQELSKSDGTSQMFRRGNDDFTLQFEVLYNSSYAPRITTQESEDPSQDSFFQVEIDKQSLGRQSVNISEGKGRKIPSNQPSPDRKRPSFQKMDRNAFYSNLSLTSPQKQEKSQIATLGTKLNSNHSHNRSNKSSKQDLSQYQRTARASQPVQRKQESPTKPVYPSTKTIKTIKQKQSLIHQSKISGEYDQLIRHGDDHHHNPEFKTVDYVHFLIVSVIFWFVGRMIKSI